MRRSRRYLQNGQLLQASEKGWGAAAHAAKLFAQHRDGLVYERHEDLDDVVIELGSVTNKFQQVSRWYGSVNRLHRNFYVDELDTDTIAALLNDAASFVDLIRQQLELTSIED